MKPALPRLRPGHLAGLPDTMRRRLLAALLAGPAGALPPVAAAATSRPDRPDYPVVRRGVPLVFPRDFGAHPDYRTEWWYLTGWLQAKDAEALGFQVTFFRSRPEIDPRNPSRFAARELVLAHVALSDPARRTLVHDQRTARSGFGLAGARTGDTDVWIDDWRLARAPLGSGSRYRANLPGERLGMDLSFDSTQPLLLHGDAGFSQKGPLARQASYYYTQPQLAVSGRVVLDARPREVQGRAWLDHEWSSEILADGATGWDWIGVNLDDGGALMAFRIRDTAGGTLWAAASWRTADGRLRTFDERAVRFTGLRQWRSPRTGASYPVEMRVEIGLPGGAASGLPTALELVPLFDDQELDARASTGIVYWEGAVTATAEGRRLGRGYLELTGYHGRLVL